MQRKLSNSDLEFVSVQADDDDNLMGNTLQKNLDDSDKGQNSVYDNVIGSSFLKHSKV